MNRLALVTWRLPHASIGTLEQARERLDEVDPGVFRLTTCQRVLLCTWVPEEASRSQRAGELADGIGLPGGERRIGFGAFRHLVEVAAGLDAIVPGEDQVPHQVRTAIDDQADALDARLHDGLQRVVSAARTVRDEAGLSGSGGRSLADRAADRIPDDARVALWGTGAIARAACDALADRTTLHVVSRDEDRAAELAGDREHAWTRAAVLEAAPAFDALLLATRSPDGRVLETRDVRRFVSAASPRSGRPFTIVDIGVPSNVEPAVAELPDVHLVNVEDMARQTHREADLDPAIRAARTALAETVLRERRRAVKAQMADRIQALREAIASDVDHLVEELDDLAGDDAGSDRSLERWARTASGRLAHTAQEHMLAATRGDDP